MKTTERSQNSASESDAARGHRKIRWWPIIRRLLTLAFFAALIWLLVSQARSIDWQQVGSALTDYSSTRIGVAMLLAVCAFLVYSCYDLFGRHYVGHGIGKRKTMATAFISYGFNLNLGALVGSVGMRYRLYSQLGLGKADIAHVLALSVTTNWLGYLLLAGIVFASGSVEVPFDWKISNLALRFLGVVFIAVVIAYLALCRFSRKRSWDLRGQELILPSLRVAILQFVTASSHWLLIGSIIFVFLSDKIDFLSLFGVLLISAIAGAVTHIPGALGVLEAVFVMLLGNEVPKGQLIAALIAYRAVFYLFPLILTVIAYLYLEMDIARSKDD